MAALPRPAWAQTFPTRPLTVIVPFAAGGPTDTVTRLVAEAMGRELGQTMVVENAGGAGGTIGAQRVANARPDGYTLLLHHIGMATTPSLYRRLAYDPVGGFEPIGLVTEVPMTLVGKRDFPANTLAEAIAVIRRDQEKLNYANAGIGAASHLCGLLLMKAVDAPMTTVPFRGTGPAMQELLAGRIDLMCDQTTSTTEQINGGAIKVFATTTPNRLATLPNVPTSTEAGLPEFQVTSGTGSMRRRAPRPSWSPGCRRRCRWRCATRSWSPASPSWAPSRWRRTGRRRRRCAPSGWPTSPSGSRSSRAPASTPTEGHGRLRAACRKSSVRHAALACRLQKQTSTPPGGSAFRRSALRPAFTPCRPACEPAGQSSRQAEEQEWTA